MKRTLWISLGIVIGSGLGAVAQQMTTFLPNPAATGPITITGPARNGTMLTVEDADLRYARIGSPQPSPSPQPSSSPSATPTPQPSPTATVTPAPSPSPRVTINGYVRIGEVRTGGAKVEIVSNGSVVALTTTRGDGYFGFESVPVGATIQVTMVTASFTPQTITQSGTYFIVGVAR